MANLTSEEIYELVRQEMARILKSDHMGRIQAPDTYRFSMALPLPDGTPLDLQEVFDPYKAQDQVDSIIQARAWPQLGKPVADMLTRLGIDLPPWEPVFNEVCYQYAQALGVTLDVIKQREGGIVDFNLPVFTSESQSAASSEPSSQAGYTLSEVIEKYIVEKLASERWGVRTQKEYPQKIKKVLEVMGDVDIGSIGHEFARDYKARLLEPNAKGKVRPVKTINSFIGAISGVFEWAERHGFISKNYFKGTALQERRSARDEKEMFTADDLALVFGSDYPGYRAREPWTFWIPLLGLYTGARVEEIAQLRIDDVSDVNGIWCIDINEGAEDKRIKNSASKRIVPLHPFIVDTLSLTSHIASVKASGAERLFPSLKRINHKYGHAVSKWFSAYATRLGVAKGKTFHSLRHTFTTNLSHRDVPINVVDWLTGHAIPGETGGRYAKPPKDPAVLMPHLLKLDFGIDLSHLAQSRFVVR